MYQASSAVGINTAGDVVGLQTDSYGGGEELITTWRTVRWSDGVPAELPLHYVKAINGAGQIIGTRDGGGILLTPAAKTWIGPASGGDWSTAANWSPSGSPAAGTRRRFMPSIRTIRSSRTSSRTTCCRRPGRGEDERHEARRGPARL
jgi:hypothetical protein